VAAVFRGIDVVPRQPPLWVTLLRWIVAWINRMLRMFAGHPAAGSVVRVAILVALVLLLLRLFVPGLVAAGIRRPRAQRATARDDWWAMAQRLAAEGAFTDAAHALYLALVSNAARRGLIAMHESKTTGDYLRELRRAARTSGARRVTDGELAGWREFVRVYETVIYGTGTCDSAQYGTLQRLATSAIPTERAA
jgi:uncharacterized membrane protein YhaH (DUF805 family)